MSGRSRDLPGSNPEGQETEKRKGKERARPPLDVTRQEAQAGGKRTRAQRSPTEHVSYSASSGDGRGPASPPVEKRSRLDGKTVPSRSTSGLDVLAQAVGKQRQIEGGRRLGEDNVALGRGWFGMTAKERNEASRKAKEKKHAVSEREQNNTANRAAGYIPPRWATEAYGSGSGSGS
jgi:hypothetical protein